MAVASQCPECGASFRGHPPACPDCGIELWWDGEDDEEQTATEAAPSEGDVAECGYCKTRITFRLGEWMDDDFGSACYDTSAPFVPHRPKEG